MQRSQPPDRIVICSSSIGTILKNYTNCHIPSEIRATLLSMQSIVGNSAFALLAPLLGGMVYLLSLRSSLSIFGLLVLVLSSVLLIEKERNDRG